MYIYLKYNIYVYALFSAFSTLHHVGILLWIFVHVSFCKTIFATEPNQNMPNIWKVVRQNRTQQLKLLPLPLLTGILSYHNLSVTLYICEQDNA